MTTWQTTLSARFLADSLQEKNSILYSALSTHHNTCNKPTTLRLIFRWQSIRSGLFPARSLLLSLSCLLPSAPARVAFLDVAQTVYMARPVTPHYMYSIARVYARCLLRSLSCLLPSVPARVAFLDVAQTVYIAKPATPHYMYSIARVYDTCHHSAPH